MQSKNTQFKIYFKSEIRVILFLWTKQRHLKTIKKKKKKKEKKRKKEKGKKRKKKEKEKKKKKKKKKRKKKKKKKKKDHKMASPAKWPKCRYDFVTFTWGFIIHAPESHTQINFNLQNKGHLYYVHI